MSDTLPQSLSALEQKDEFIARHIGPCASEMSQMLAAIGAASLDQLVDQTVPAAIRFPADLPLPAPRREHEAPGRPEGPGRSQCGEEVPHRTGLSRDPDAQGDPAQRAGKPGLVHRLHPLPGRDRPGPPGSPAQLPAGDHRPHRPGTGQRLPAGRSHRRRRGHDHGPPRLQVRLQPLLRGRSLLPPRPSTWSRPGPPTSASS